MEIIVKHREIFKKKGNGTPAVKICGLTDPFEAVECAKFGVDAIGIVFYRKSPRFVSMKQAAEICSALPSDIFTTGVFVDESYDFIMERVERCSLKAVQLHGNESLELVHKLAKTGTIVIKALFAGKKPFFENADLFIDASAFLVECGKGILPGGNAEQWNWEMAKKITKDHTIILAGGLTPYNVRTAIASAAPDIVDVSSGVEISHGKKDIEKVKLFIKNVQFCSISSNAKILSTGIH